MWLDVRSAITAYVERILSVPGGDTHQYKDNLMILNQLDSDGDGVKGMKVLVVDKETVGIISSVVTQSFLLEREVYLTSYIVESTKNCKIWLFLS